MSNPCCQCNPILFLCRLSVSSSLFPPSTPSPLLPSPSLRLSSPPFRRHPDVHLSLTSGWVHLGLNSCRIQTVCLHLIGSVLMFSPIVLSLSFWLLAVSHRSCAILFSFLVPRFQFLVFSYLSSGFAFLVPRSQFDTTALLSQSIYTFFSSFTLSFTLSSVGSSSLSSFLPLDVMTFTSC